MEGKGLGAGNQVKRTHRKQLFTGLQCQRVQERRRVGEPQLGRWKGLWKGLQRLRAKLMSTLAAEEPKGCQRIAGRLSYNES